MKLKENHMEILKPAIAQNMRIFSDLGFYVIEHVEDKLVFMENRKNGFTSFLKNLTRTGGESTSIVVNYPSPKGNGLVTAQS